MQTIAQKKVHILDMAKGALSEEVNVQLERVAENLLDPNTDWKKARRLTINIDFITDEQRQITRATATTAVKLQPSKPVSTQLAFGVNSRGLFHAVELTGVTPGQIDIEGNEEPPANVFAMGKAQKAAQA